MTTKEKIVKRAIQLFNKNGSGNVTTNHIADAAGISPGNLYYHYKNKEEIIRDIFEHILANFKSLWTSMPTVSSPFEMFEAIFLKTFSVQHKYKFFHYELNSLLNNDKILKKKFRENQQKRLEEIKQFVNLLIEEKILKDLDDKSIYDELIELSWFISNFWMIQVEISQRKFNSREIHKNLILILEPFGQYFTQNGLEEYNRFKSKWLNKVVG